MPPRPSPSTRVIGVLGGIAAGKSLAARALAGPRGWVIDADAIAREVLELPEVRAELGASFGRQVVPPAGPVDRQALASAVFGDPAARERLERFTHSRIRARIRTLLEQARAARVPRVVLDVPLLLENDAQHGLVGECDLLVFVDCAEDLREARARAARGWPAGEVARREAAQMPLAAKRARAGRVLRNEGARADLERQAAELLELEGLATTDEPLDRDEPRT